MIPKSFDLRSFRMDIKACLLNIYKDSNKNFWRIRTFSLSKTFMFWLRIWAQLLWCYSCQETLLQMDRGEERIKNCFYLCLTRSRLRILPLSSELLALANFWALSFQRSPKDPDLCVLIPPPDRWSFPPLDFNPVLFDWSCTVYVYTNNCYCCVW